MTTVVASAELPESPIDRRRREHRPLALAEKAREEALDANGSHPIAPGITQHRACPDRAPQLEQPNDGEFLQPAEAEAVRAAFAPFADIERKQDHADEMARAARYSNEPAKRELLPELQAKVDEIKDLGAKARGVARVAALNAIEASARRAGSRYQAAVGILAQAAAELEGLATFRDELLGQATFDPLGIWQRQALLAPPLAYRAPGWSVSRDVFSRECLWSPETAAHGEELRRVKAGIKAELVRASNAPTWPF